MSKLVPPPEFSRAEVVAVLRKYYDSRERQ